MALAFLFLRSFLKEKSGLRTYLKVVIILTIAAFSFFTSYFLTENIIILSSVSILSAFIIGISCFKEKPIGIAIAAIFQWIAGVFSELVSAFIITNLHEVYVLEVMQYSIYRFQARTLSQLIYLLFIFLVNRYRSVSFDAIALKSMILLASLPVASIAVIILFMINVTSYSNVATINEMITLVSIITSNILIFSLFENIVSKHKKGQALLLVEAQNAIQQNHISHLLDANMRIRKMSHDFKHQVEILHTLCHNGKYNELLEKLAEISNRNVRALIVSTGNTILDAILSSKKEEADKQGIDFEIKLEVQPKLQFMTMELCVLLGNALDNAIEACLSSNIEKKYIELNLDATSKKFMFKIKNTIGDRPQLEAGFLKTKKADMFLHGIGLRSMTQTCDSLGGDIAYDFDDEYFRVWVNIPAKRLDSIKDSVLMNVAT